MNKVLGILNILLGSALSIWSIILYFAFITKLETLYLDSGNTSSMILAKIYATGLLVSGIFSMFVGYKTLKNKHINKNIPIIALVIAGVFVISIVPAMVLTIILPIYNLTSQFQ